MIKLCIIVLIIFIIIFLFKKNEKFQFSNVYDRSSVGEAPHIEDDSMWNYIYENPNYPPKNEKIQFSGIYNRQDFIKNNPSAYPVPFTYTTGAYQLHRDISSPFFEMFPQRGEF